MNALRGKRASVCVRATDREREVVRGAALTLSFFLLVFLAFSGRSSALGGGVVLEVFRSCSSGAGTWRASLLNELASPFISRDLSSPSACKLSLAREAETERRCARKPSWESIKGTETNRTASFFLSNCFFFVEGFFRYVQVWLFSFFLLPVIRHYRY